ncbi:hypothetical protein [Neobacillus soli]|uniref:hypothetical protein n=1 Tax=Neobacillus soli TaxID=220688 RepID=UPI000AF08E17|nr:hypothetical protein [Neobacillus soli]
MSKNSLVINLLEDYISNRIHHYENGTENGFRKGCIFAYQDILSIIKSCTREKAG